MPLPLAWTGAWCWREELAAVLLNLPLELSVLCHSFVPSLAASPNVDAFQPLKCWMSDS